MENAARTHRLLKVYCLEPGVRMHPEGRNCRIHHFYPGAGIRAGRIYPGRGSGPNHAQAWYRRKAARLCRNLDCASGLPCLSLRFFVQPAWPDVLPEPWLYAGRKSSRPDQARGLGIHILETVAAVTPQEQENTPTMTLKNLKKIDLFKNLSDAELKELEPYHAAVLYGKRETIFSEGEPPEWFYIVVKGKVKVTKLSHDGKEIILEVISPYDIFGGVAVLRNFPYPANAVAMEDSEVLKISRKNLMRLVDRFPNLMYCIARQLGDRMKSSYDTLKNIALERVEARIAALLLKLSNKVGVETDKGVLIDMRLTKQDVADMVGTTVETSIRTFSKFKKQGLLTDSNGKIIITDHEGLMSFSS